MRCEKENIIATDVILIFLLKLSPFFLNIWCRLSLKFQDYTKV